MYKMIIFAGSNGQGPGPMADTNFIGTSVTGTPAFGARASRAEQQSFLIALPSRFAALAATDPARYAAAFSITALALVGRWLLNPVLADRVPFAVIYAAVALSAIFLGLGPSIASAAVGLVCVRLFFMPHIFRGSSIQELSETISYLGACTIIIATTEVTRRSREKLKIANRDLALQAEELLTFSLQLDQRVQQRTIELQIAEEAARQLGGQVLRMQDEERRRIARELHDSVGQAIAVLKMNLGHIGRSENLTDIEAAIVAESKAIASVASDEVRTISHLLHPPLLDDMGLPAALKWFVRGFATRSGISAQLELSEKFGRMPADCEIAIFRIVQEALTNVHRHAHSVWAVVRVIWTPSQVKLEISDKGRGIPPEKLRDFSKSGIMGVGIRGMRERVDQLGGYLDLESSKAGTTVRVKLPLVPSGSVTLVSTTN
jgi:signal transduction histidine kinase